MKKKFIILAESFWDSGGIGGNSSQQYARTLMHLGWDVSYVEPNGAWKLKKLHRIEDPKNAIVMCDFPCTEYNKKVFFSLAHLGCHNVCLIVDHWESIDIDKHYKPELEPEFVKSAEQAFACNPLNVDRLKPLRPDIQLLRNGVDLKHFDSSNCKNTISIPCGRITLGLVASFWIPRWIDLEPLLNYAYNHQEDTVNIVGNASSVINDDECPPNVILHGIKHWRDIPAYIHQFDLCVVPYNPLTTMYTNPIKVLEYLACGKPVISCYNPSITDYPYVYFYNNTRDFENSVEEASSNPVDKAFLVNFLKKHTWEERINTILSNF